MKLYSVTDFIRKDMPRDGAVTDSVGHGRREKRIPTFGELLDDQFKKKLSDEYKARLKRMFGGALDARPEAAMRDAIRAASEFMSAAEEAAQRTGRSRFTKVGKENDK